MRTPKKKPRVVNKAKAKATEVALPSIPEKLYFTIGEVAELCLLKPHVLRYWEQEFNALNPAKRRGNRRYYQYKDVLLIRRIRNLLYEQGYTIEGARQQLASETVAQAMPVENNWQDVCKNTIAELEELLLDLQATAVH